MIYTVYAQLYIYIYIKITNTNNNDLIQGVNATAEHCSNN
jgi:hypothetical protein